MDNALLQAKDHVLAEYRAKGYKFWQSMIGQDELMFPHPNDSLIEIGLSSLWDRVKPGGAIRVVVSIFSRRKNPHPVPTTSFLVFEDESIDEFKT